MAFFKRKAKSEAKAAAPKILDAKNIQTNCKAANSDEAIKSVGKLLLDGGFITEGYIQGMLNRDHDITTYIGNDIAIPHGEYEVKDCVKNTGLAVQIYPDGISWGGGNVRIVIGIAASTEDHVSILQNIAEKLGDMEMVETVVRSNPEKICEILTIA